MSKVTPYQEEQNEDYDAGHGKYLEGKTVPTGKTLFVSHIGATFVNCATTEYIEVGYWNGHAYVPVYKNKPANTSDFVHWNGKLWLREGQRIYAYFADIAAGERMKLRAEGRWE